VLQGGTYGEHRLRSITLDGREVPLDGALPTVELAAGCGATLRILTDRYARAPSLRRPWDYR
jgi:hypothetical protein